MTHVVCKDCFAEIANRNSKCPVCRAPMNVNLRVKLELGDRKVKPKKAILTNLSNEIDYNEIKKKLPKNVIPAHDGLTVLI